MTLIEVVILAGAHCLSPVQEAEGTTEIGKVPCAVLIRLDETTGDVDFTPPSAATRPPGDRHAGEARRDESGTPAGLKAPVRR